MVLMRVLAPVGKDEIRLKLTAQSVDGLLDLPSRVREKTVFVMMDDDGLLLRSGQKGFGAVPRFAFALADSAEYDPIENEFAVVLSLQFQERPTTSDFNVVSMGTQTQNS